MYSHKPASRSSPFDKLLLLSRNVTTTPTPGPHATWNKKEGRSKQPSVHHGRHTSWPYPSNPLLRHPWMSRVIFDELELTAVARPCLPCLPISQLGDRLLPLLLVLVLLLLLLLLLSYLFCLSLSLHLHTYSCCASRAELRAVVNNLLTRIHTYICYTAQHPPTHPHIPSPTHTSHTHNNRLPWVSSLTASTNSPSLSSPAYKKARLPPIQKAQHPPATPSHPIPARQQRNRPVHGSPPVTIGQQQ